MSKKNANSAVLMSSQNVHINETLQIFEGEGSLEEQDEGVDTLLPSGGELNDEESRVEEPAVGVLLEGNDNNDDNISNEDRKTGGDDGEVPTSDQGSKMDKPQIWVRIRQGAIDNGLYEIGEDRKTLKLVIKPEDRLFQKKSGKTVCFSFETEGILHGASQDELYDVAVSEIVDNAMEGVSGVVSCIGPEASGKSHSLFGPDSYFHFRGIVPRAIEDIFSRMDSKNKGDFHIILSMFQVRKDKMKDLITLNANELTRVGNFGPKGLFFEEVLSVDHALGLIFRGLEGQRQMPGDAHAKYHTLIYIDILANLKVCGYKQESWRSRITFAKIASMSSKDKMKKLSAVKTSKSSFSLCRTGCADTSSLRKDNCYATDGIPRKCCGGPQGPLAEMISIRKDMYFLEQMFTKSYDLRKITEYYNELQKLGMYMLMRPPNVNPSQYFRQSKLAHCLKDTVSGSAMVRLILHIRPERAFLNSTLEIMRFAERARCVPCEITRKSGPKDCSSFEQKTCEEAGVDTNDLSGDRRGMFNPDKMREVFKTAASVFEEKLDSLDGSCKDQVKSMFDGFQEVWGQILDKELAQENERDKVETVDNDDGKVNEEQPDMSETQSNRSLSQTESKKNLKLNSSTKKLKPDKEEASKLSADKADEKKNKKRAPRQSVVNARTGRTKGRQDAKDVDESGDMNKKRDRLVNKKSASQQQSADEDDEEEDEGDDTIATVADDGPIQDLSISVIPVGTADPIDGTSLIANLHFKCKCWEAFARTETGNPLVTELGEKQNLLKQYMTEHNETLKEVVNALSRLVAIELNLDQLEPNRRFSDEADELNLLTTKEQRKETAAAAQREFAKLQSNQANIRSLVSILDASKNECGKAFDAFCMDSHGKPDFANRPIDGELEKRYDDICRIAKQEAQALIRKAYPMRPPWTTFY